MGEQRPDPQFLGLELRNSLESSDHPLEVLTICLMVLPRFPFWCNTDPGMC